MLFTGRGENSEEKEINLKACKVEINTFYSIMNINSKTNLNLITNAIIEKVTINKQLKQLVFADQNNLNISTQNSQKEQELPETPENLILDKSYTFLNKHCRIKVYYDVKYAIVIEFIGTKQSYQCSFTAQELNELIGIIDISQLQEQHWIIFFKNIVFEESTYEIKVLPHDQRKKLLGMQIRKFDKVRYKIFIWYYQQFLQFEAINLYQQNDRLSQDYTLEVKLQALLKEVKLESTDQIETNFKQIIKKLVLKNGMLKFPNVETRIVKAQKEKENSWFCRRQKLNNLIQQQTLEEKPIYRKTLQINSVQYICHVFQCIGVINFKLYDNQYTLIHSQDLSSATIQALCPGFTIENIEDYIEIIVKFILSTKDDVNNSNSEPKNRIVQNTVVKHTKQGLLGAPSFEKSGSFTVENQEPQSDPSNLAISHSLKIPEKVKNQTKIIKEESPKQSKKIKRKTYSPSYTSQLISDSVNSSKNKQIDQQNQKQLRQNQQMPLDFIERINNAQLLLRTGHQISQKYCLVSIFREHQSDSLLIEVQEKNTKAFMYFELKNIKLSNVYKELDQQLKKIVSNLEIKQGVLSLVKQNILYKQGHSIDNRYFMITVFENNGNITLEADETEYNQKFSITLQNLNQSSQQDLFEEVDKLVQKLTIQKALGQEVLCFTNFKEQ